jgi:hypothetical protein
MLIGFIKLIVETGGPTTLVSELSIQLLNEYITIATTS